MIRKLLLILPFLLVSIIVEAAIPDVKFRRLDTRNGLSNSQVNCVFRDSHGYIWIGTSYGLNRYDGYRVKAFFSSMRDTTTMRDNYTDQIMEDAEGRLWLKQGMNYCVYDPVTEKFERNVSRVVDKFLPGRNAVERVYIDHDKNYWIKFYEEGIFYYNTKTKKTTEFRMGYGKNQIKEHYGIAAMTDYPTGLVIMTYTGELLCLNGKTGEIEWENSWMHEHGVLESQNYKLLIDKEENLYVVAEHYTFIYVKKENRWYSTVRELMLSQGIEGLPEGLQVWDVKIDHKNRMWVATDHMGIFVIDRKDKEVRQFLNNKFDESTISDNTPRQIYVDDLGLVWISTYKNGVNEFKEGLASIANLELDFYSELEYLCDWIRRRVNYLDHNTFAIYLLGDANGDGLVTISDVTLIIDYLLTDDGSALTAINADVDLDGNITIADVTALIDMLLVG